MRGSGIYGELIDRGKSALRMGLAAYLFGVLLFYAVGCLTGMNARFGRSVTDLTDDVWTIRHCLYQAGITFTTVGYTDELGTDAVRIYRHPGTGHHYAWNSHDGLVPAPGAASAALEDLLLVEDYSLTTTLTTVLLAVIGMAVFIYAIGAITAFFVEGGYLELRLRRRAEKSIGRLRDHVIVCGATPTGLHTVARFLAEGAPLVVVDGDEVHIHQLRERFPAILHLVGDPTDVELLREAGLARARGLVASLADDNDNLVVVVTVKQERPDLRVVARSSSREEAPRLARAGATEVVTPATVGGMRLASEAIRPTVVRLLDAFLGHEEERMGHRFVPLVIGEGTPLCGRSLAEARFGDRTGLRVLALRAPGEAGFTYNPDPDRILETGTCLAVVANDDGIARARALVEGNGNAGGTG